MKKLLLSLVTALSFTTYAVADEFTYDFVNNDYNMTRLSGNTNDYNPIPFTVTDSKTDVTVTLDGGNNRLWADGIRFYTGSTFEVGGAKITEIVITYKSQTACNAFDLDGTVGTYTKNKAVGTWTGEAEAVKFKYNTNKNQAVQSIKVTYTPNVQDNRKDAGLAFSAESVTAIVGEAFTAPTLTKATTAAVNYTSSNTNVATVDAKTGEVTLVAAGTTMITAAADENTDYKAGMAEYELIVFPEGTIYLGLEENANDWTIDNGTLPEGLTYVWQWDASYKYMKASAYKGGNYATSATVTSPEIDLTVYKDAALQFEQVGNFFKGNMQNDVKVLVSANGGEFEAVEVAPWPTADGWTPWITSNASLAKYNGKKIKVQFLYTSTTERAGTWEIKNLTVTGTKGIDAPEIAFDSIAGKVSMTAPLEGAQIYYTIDGTEPTTASNLYNGAFALENDCTVKAIAVVNDVISPVASIDCKVFKGTEIAIKNYSFEETGENATPLANLVGWTAVGDKSNNWGTKNDAGMWTNGKFGIRLVEGTGSINSGNYVMQEVENCAAGTYVLVLDGVVSRNSWRGGFNDKQKGFAFVAYEKGDLNDESNTEGLSCTYSGNQAPGGQKYYRYYVVHTTSEAITENTTIKFGFGIPSSSDAIGKISMACDNFHLYYFDTKDTEKVKAYVEMNMMEKHLDADMTVNNGSKDLVLQGFESNIAVAAPAISCFENVVTITAEEGRTIHYTIDGTEPTADSETYTEPFEITEDVTVKAIAVSKFGRTSTVAELFCKFLKDPGLKFAQSNIDIELGDNYEVGDYIEIQPLEKLTTAEATLTVSDPAVVAMIDGKLQIIGTGVATITATVPTNDEFLRGSASYTVTVTQGTYAGSNVATFVFTGNTNLGTNLNPLLLTQDNILLTINGRSDNTAQGLAIYDPASINVTGGDITKIIIACVSAEGPVQYSVEPGVDATYTVSGLVGTWTGNESKINIMRDNSAPVAITSIKVIYSGSTQGVEGIEAEEAEANAEYYNLQGVRVVNPSTGVYIKVQGNKATKVYVK